MKNSNIRTTKLTALMLSVLLALATVTGFAFAEAAEEEPFSLWNPDAPALNALIEYVESVTDPDSPDFIPEADRIATFDLDGTLMGELAPTYMENVMLMHRVFDDPSYLPDAEMVEFCRMMRDHALDKSFPEDFEYEFSSHLNKAFAGMTPDEYIDYVTRFLVTEADGFEGMTYADACYLPMTEVVDYLRDNSFKCYIVSGSDRFTVRAFVEGVIDIPCENCIGSDPVLKARDQGDAKDCEYLFTSDDSLVRAGELLVKDVKTSKVLQIAQEIGRQPVLSFGNSSGDMSMHNYVLLNNRYKCAAFQLVADDDVRDYGNPEKGAELREKWEGMGYHAISMRDDWKTIYGEDVQKTGEFHWLTDYADDRILAAPETAIEEEADTETNPDVQYVLYLGTNDKDTNKPVFTQAEALEQAKDILIRHFGGYTIQEAHGGWIDDETKYQEYTLVIYLSDTTIDKVHAAADEMIEVFNQSSVLIQENPTRTEFYSSANP